MESARATTANVTIKCDTETFALLAYGRASLEQTESKGRLTVKGETGISFFNRPLRHTPSEVVPKMGCP
ncbi:MAG: hypothetical protein CM1200mP27_13510 [Chloroflexota bacterium]|nr:MAG: hypothetical protein CM1200mP27_13510 [Chloroflexota bacterium]